MEDTTLFADVLNASSGAELVTRTGKCLTINFTEFGDIFDDSSTENTYWYNDGYYYYYYYYGNSDDSYYNYHTLEIYPFEIYALGYVQPILVLLTTLSNVFVAGFFLTRKDRGKATNLLFVSIALSDTMTGITLVPNGVEVYARNFEDLSETWCKTYMTLRFYVSPVFHTVSVWQTVVLCIQRYLCVCHPFISSRICTFWKTFVSIVVMYLAAMVLHVYHLVDNKVGHRTCRWRTEIPCKESCMYLWFTVVLQHLLPCILLVALTAETITKLMKAQRRLSSMAHKKSASRSIRDKRITYTALLIVLFFLIPELPYGIYKLVFVIFKHEGKNNFFSAKENHILLSVYELALTVSFCANFWIYCFMMRDFRRQLTKILTCVIIKHGFARLRSFSASSRGTIGTTLSRSSSNASRTRVFSRTMSLHSTTSENIHAVIPLTPTKGYNHINFQTQTSIRLKDDDINDDVFVDEHETVN